MRVLGREGLYACTSVFAGIHVVWVREEIYFTVHWEDLGQITPQGGQKTDGASAAECTGWYVGVPPRWQR